MRFYALALASLAILLVPELSAAASSQSVVLSPGWNIVSTPRIVDSHAFSATENSENFSIYALDSSRPSGWATIADLGQQDFTPLYGYFIDNKTGADQTLTLTYSASTTPNQQLFQRTFPSTGWYSFGIANPTYSLPQGTGLGNDTDNPSSILFSLAGAFSNILDFTDSHFTIDPDSPALSSAWKEATPFDLSSLHDFRDTKGYGIYINKGGALYNGFQNSGSEGGSASSSTSGAALTVGNDSSVSPANIPAGAEGTVLGGFTIQTNGVHATITSLQLRIATTSGAEDELTDITLVDENGTVVAGPVDASGSTITFTDTIEVPAIGDSYIVKGNIPESWSEGSQLTLSTTPSTQWNSSATLSTSTVVMSTQTVQQGAAKISLSATPQSQTIVAGRSFTFANIILNAENSGEDLRLSSFPLILNSILNRSIDPKNTGSPDNLSNCVMSSGSTALTTGSNVVDTLHANATTTFTFDNALEIPKGTLLTLALTCNLSSAATTSSEYAFSTDTVITDYAITGAQSGNNITPAVISGNSGTITVGEPRLTLSVDASSPASTTVAAGGSAGVTVGVYKLRASNDTATLTKLSVKLTAGSAADIKSISFYSSEGTLLGSTVFDSDQTVATSTLTTPLTLPHDVDVKITAKATFTDIGTNKAGTEGDVVEIDPNAAEGNVSHGTIQATGIGKTRGVRVYNSLPTFTYSTRDASGTLINGNQDLLSLTVSADSAGDIGLYKLTFELSTTTAQVSNLTFTGPNGNVSSSTPLIESDRGTNIVVFFDSASNTADASVMAGASKTYSLRGTVAGLTSSNSGTVSLALKSDAAPVAIGTTNDMIGSNLIWSPLSTTTASATSTNDWTNGYAVTTGCFSSIELGHDCTPRLISK